MSEASVNLSWSSVANATSYLVQLSTNDDFSSGVVEQTVAGTNATFNGLNNFTEYFWRVQAKNGANFGNFTDDWSFVTRVGMTTITNPANNAVGVPLNGNLQWTAVNGATSYDVMLIKTPATTILNQNVAGTQLAYTNLENFANYEVRVTAKNADGSGAQVTSTFRTILGIPNLLTPANNSFNNPLAGTLTWSAVTGAVSYNLLVATDAAFNNVVVTQNDIAGTNYAYNGFVNNQKYYWKVLAKNAEGTGAFSGSFGFTTLLGNVTLVSPANNATQVSLNPTLTWNSLAGATNYHVQVSTNAAFTQIIFENNSVAGTSVGLTNLSGKTNYYFRVKGFNANNEGGFSTANMFTTVLSKVILTSPANNAQGLLAASGTLSWQSQGGVTGYDILVSTNPDLSAPIVNTSTVNASYNYSGLNNNTTYYWAVRSKDNEGVGPYSDTWSFGTQILAPNLLTPADNAVNIPLIGSCTWSSVAGATSYELQIATDNAFNTILFSETGINGTTGDYEGLENAEIHYWRVRAYKNAGAGLWSNVRSFKTIALSPPTLVFPPNNSYDLYTTVALVWNSVADALGYNVRVATDPGFINVVAQANNLTVTNYTVSNLFLDRDYYWQVQTIGQQGTSNWSNAFTFKTLTDPEINGPMTVCENREATYTTKVSPLVDYQWAVTGGTIVGSSTGNTLKVNWGGAGQGTVKITRSSQAWGNYTDNKTINVTKSSVENVNITINADTYYNGKACLNEVVTFSADVNSNGIFDYSWKVGNNVVSTSETFDYHFTTKGTYVISLTLTGVDCEGGYASMTLNAVDDCAVTIVNADRIDVCKGSSPQLMTKVFGGSGQFTYSWAPASQLVSGSVVSPIVKSASTSRNFKLTVYDVVNMKTYYDNDLYMYVRTSASVSFSPNSLVVYNGNAIDLTDENVVKITVTGGTAPFNYNWSDVNGDPISDPSEVYPSVGQNRYYLTVNDADGCNSIKRQFLVYYYNQKVHGEVVTGLGGEGFMLTYPNPVQNDLNIFADFSSLQNVKVKVLDLLGQEVYSENLGNHTIYEGSLDLSRLSAGAYTLIVETETDVMVKVFIKQ